MDSIKPLANKYKYDKSVYEMTLSILKSINKINTNNNTIMLEYIDSETYKVVDISTSIKLYIHKIKGDVIIIYNDYKKIIEIEIINEDFKTIFKHTLDVDHNNKISIDVLNEFIRVKNLKLDFIEASKNKDLNDILNCGFRLE